VFLAPWSRSRLKKKQEPEPFEKSQEPEPEKKLPAPQPCYTYIKIINHSVHCSTLQTKRMVGGKNDAFTLYLSCAFYEDSMIDGFTVQCTCMH